MLNERASKPHRDRRKRNSLDFHEERDQPKASRRLFHERVGKSTDLNPTPSSPARQVCCKNANVLEMNARTFAEIQGVKTTQPTPDGKLLAPDSATITFEAFQLGSVK